MYKISNGLTPPLIFTQSNSHSYNLRLNSQFSRHFLGLYFMGPKVCPILVQLSVAFFLVITKTFKRILLFFKTRLKNGNLRVAPAVFTKNTNL